MGYRFSAPRQSAPIRSERHGAFSGAPTSESTHRERRLGYAARSGDLTATDRLIDGGGNLGARDHADIAAMHDVAWRGRTRAIKALLPAGAGSTVRPRAAPSVGEVLRPDSIRARRFSKRSLRA